MLEIMNNEVLIYPELSTQIINLTTEVYKALGCKNKNKVYQRAFAEVLRQNNIKFKEQVYFPVKYNGQIVERRFFDFLIDDKMILEIVNTSGILKTHEDNLYEYLVNSGIKLGILAYFGTKTLQFRKVVFIDPEK